MGPIAFNAGAIQATLTLDRDPFQRGLDEAKAEADRFASNKYSAKLGVDDVEAKTKIEDIRASAARLATDTSSIKIDADAVPATTKIEQVRTQTEGLARTTANIKVDADTAPILAKMAKVQANLAQLQREKANPTIDLDIAAAEVKRQKLVDDLDALRAKKADPKIDLDIAAAELKRIELAAKLDEIQSKPYTAKAELDEGKILLQIAQVQARLEALQAQKTTLQIDTDEAAFLVKIAQAQAAIDKLTVKKATISVDADIGAAQAQLAALQAQLDATGNGAESAGSQFNAMFAGIAAAYPPAATAVLSLSGALSLAVVPMAAIAVGMTGIQAAAAPLAGQFLNLQSVVSATFEQGMKPAITDISALMPTLTSGLVGTAGALSTVAQQVMQVVASKQGLADLQATFTNVQSIIAGMAPGIAGLVQNFLDLASLGTSSLGGLSTIINGLSTQWHELIVNLTASGQAQGAMSSLTQALGAVLAILPPLVAQGVQLMDVLGPPLVGALQLVGGALNLLSGPLGGLTSTVLAGAAAWKVLSVVVNAGIWETIGAKIAATAAAMGIGTVATAEATVATQASTVALGEEAVAATAASVGVGRLTAAAGFAAAAQGRLAVASEASTVASAAGAAGAGRFAGAMAGLSSAILPVGVALVAGYTAVKAFTYSTDDAVKAMGQGGQAAADMKGKIDAQTVGFNASTVAQAGTIQSLGTWIATNWLGAGTTQSVTDAINAQRDAMTPLQRAQQDATVAQGDYNKAVKDSGPNSTQAAEAQKKYADATLAVTQAQAGALVAQTNIDSSLQAAAAHFGDAAQAADGAAQSTVSYANALASLADPMASASDKMKAFAADTQGASDAPRTLLDAMNAVDKSMTSFAESTIRITPALVDATGAINTTTKAGQQLATGISGTAKAYDNLRGATIASAQAAGDDLPTALVKGDVALENARQKLITLAMQHGATKVQAQGLVDTYLAFPPSVKTEISAPGAAQAAADALGLKDKITAIPNDKSVVVSSITADAETKLSDLGYTVTHLPNGKVLIEAQPEGFYGTLNAALDKVKTTVANLPFGGDPAKFNVAVEGAKAGAAASPATVPLTGNPATFNGVVANALTHALSSVATMPLTGNPAGFNGIVSNSLSHALSSLATMPITGNPGGFNTTVSNALSHALQSLATMPLTGNPGQFNTAVGGAQSYAGSHAATVPINGNNAAALASVVAVAAYAALHAATVIIKSVVGQAAGGILRPMADGGIIANADGNSLTPMQGGIAATVAPNTWRVIGDNMKVPESYIPHDGSARSKAILGQTAADMGYGLVPKGLSDALKAAGGPTGSDGSSAGAALASSPSVNTGSTAVVDELQQLRRDTAAGARATAVVAAKLDQVVTQLRQGGAGAQIVVNDKSGDPVETARSTMLQLRMRR